MNDEEPEWLRSISLPCQREKPLQSGRNITQRSTWMNSHIVAYIPKQVMSKSCDNLKHNKLVIFSKRKYFILSRWPKNSLDIFEILFLPGFCVTICCMQSIHLYTTTVFSYNLSSNNVRERDKLLTACYYSSFLW